MNKKPETKKPVVVAINSKQINATVNVVGPPPATGTS
jgi:hypothetical protein|tara:strand:+ start:746 stop:856 length:111 start_codon:yes stop_codon:yes gene_type:complete